MGTLVSNSDNKKEVRDRRVVNPHQALEFDANKRLFVAPAKRDYNASSGIHFIATYRRRLKGTDYVLTVRPKVTELQFQLYGRTLHPELFTVYQSRQVERGKYQARIDITSAGHVVTWQYEGLTLTEVAAAANHPLPERRRLLKYRLHGERTDQLKCRSNVTYQVAFQLEPVDPVVFWSFQKEITRSENRNGMLQIFNSSGRMALGAVSYINVETRQRSLLVQAFHTFPDDCAIVKVQSRFECPAD